MGNIHPPCPYKNMPIDCDIDHEKRLVIATFRGVVADAEIFAYQRDVWLRPEVHEFDELVDLTGATEIEYVSNDRVSELAVLAAKMDVPAVKTKLAIVAVTDVHFGLARMYQTKREIAKPDSKTVRVFRGREEALRWLGGEAC